MDIKVVAELVNNETYEVLTEHKLFEKHGIAVLGAGWQKICGTHFYVKGSDVERARNVVEERGNNE